MAGAVATAPAYSAPAPIAPSQSLSKPALKHARTEVHSDSESRPMRRTSCCSNVTGNNLKKDGW